MQSHYSTLNLANLAHYTPGGRKTKDQTMTMEFRQHDGTLDSAEVGAWLDVVVSLVQHAHYTPTADFDRSLQEWQAPNYYSTYFLDDIGCSQDTLSFYRNRLEACPASQEYDVDVFQEDMSGFFTEKNMIAPLLELVASNRAERLDLSKIRERITNKFSLGGYGQFTADYLDHIHFDDANQTLREKLIAR